MKIYETQISVSINEVFYNTPMLIHLSIVYSCFHITTAETVWSAKPKIFSIWPFTEKVCQPLAKSFIFNEYTKGTGKKASGSHRARN